MEEQGDIFGDVERGGIISARGTGGGLVIRIDGRVPEDTLRGVIEDFLTSRRSFLEGNEVALEWVGSKPSDSFVDELSHSIFKDFDVTVKVSKLRDAKAPRQVIEDDEIEMDPAEVIKLTTSLGRQMPSTGEEEFEKAPSRRKGSSAGLFGGIEALTSYDKESGQGKGKAPVGGETGLWDDADARIVYATLRSGQKIETEHSLILFGDLNSGAEIVAGGDIVVLGTLRGVAHAGAYDETGGGRVIVALNLQPTQLRIGMVISRGASDSRAVAEVARIEGNSIVVEPYNARVILQRHK